MHATLARDACDLLDADHLAVKHLFVEYARLAYAPSSDGADRAAIARRICDAIDRHASLEEEIFYPEMRRACPDAADVLDEAQAEHDEAKALVARIRGLGAADETMDRAVSELARAIEHHVKEERDELFPKARTAPGMDLGALAGRLEARRRGGAGGDPPR